MMTKIVYLTIGLPGAGKSTWFKKQNFPVEQTFRVSMDDIRKEMTGSVEDQSMNAQVASEANKRYEKALKGGVPIIVWDATNTVRKYRRDLIKIAKMYDYEVVGVWFDVPLDVAKERNSKRERTVPEFVLDKKYQQLQQNPPSRDEGFDVIQKVS
jgi:predicted kinase